MLGTNKTTFMNVFASVQGAPQKLLDMEGAELQRFIESVIGIDRLDVVLKECGRRIASCRDKTEALEYMLLTADQLEETTASLAQKQEESKQVTGKLNSYREALKTATQLSNDASARVVGAMASNRDLKSYEERLEFLKTQLAGRVEVEVTDPNPFEIALQEADWALSELRKAVSAQAEINKAHELYQANVKQLEAALAELPSDLKVWDARDIASSEMVAGVLRAKVDALSQANRDKSRINRDLEAYIARRDHTTEQWASMGTVTVVTQEQLNAAREAVALSADRVATLTRLLHEAVCPTCKRPFETLDIPSTEAELETTRNDLTQDRNVLSSLEEGHAKFRKWAQLEQDIALLTAQIKPLEDALAALPDTSNLSVEQEQYDCLLAGIASKKADNVRSADIMAQRDKFQSRLDALQVPDGAVAEIPDLSKEEAIWSNAYQALSEVKSKIQAQLEYNRTVRDLQEKIAALVRPPVDYIEIIPLELEAAKLKKIQRDLELEIEASRDAFHEIEMAIQPLESTLAQHREAAERGKEFFALAENYRFISQLLSNSRAGFISRAMTTIFGVATEFAKLCTGGDIQEVIFDGNIKFKEEGRLRSKALASGAQCAVIGLGMKLGVANLVVSDFGTLLLDEATAAMSEEISLQSSLAMASLCEQSISVSHRKMDIAGNIIELTGGAA